VSRSGGVGVSLSVCQSVGRRRTRNEWGLSVGEGGRSACLSRSSVRSSVGVVKRGRKPVLALYIFQVQLVHKKKRNMSTTVKISQGFSLSGEEVLRRERRCSYVSNGEEGCQGGNRLGHWRVMSCHVRQIRCFVRSVSHQTLALESGVGVSAELRRFT
jgi:hypothetical protein